VRVSAKSVEPRSGLPGRVDVSNADDLFQACPAAEDGYELGEMDRRGMSADMSQGRGPIPRRREKDDQRVDTIHEP